MAVQAVWYEMVLGTSTEFLRAIQGMSTTRSMVTEEGNSQDVYGNETTWSKAYVGAAEFDINLTFTRAATGQDPRRNYGDWYDHIGTHARFYLGGRMFMASEFTLTSVTTSNWVLDPFGEALSLDVQLHFKEFILDNQNSFHLLDHQNRSLIQQTYYEQDYAGDYWEWFANRLFNKTTADSVNRIPFNPQYQSKYTVGGHTMNAIFFDQQSGWY